jgi:peptide chain release factor 2
MTGSGGTFDYAGKRDRLEEVNRELENPAVWGDPERAQDLGRERARLDETVGTLDRLQTGLNDVGEMVELAQEENDDELLASVASDLRHMEQAVEQLEFARMFSGEMDQNACFIDIQAGSGGTEAQDWAEMLLRMYSRWAERKGYKVEVVEYQAGEQAGIKSATLLIKGENAYGYAKTESGVHRLVRISPYDSSARRHTSFSSVWVYPGIDDDIDIEVNPADLKIDTYRASGAGGQHINTTDSAVRITHMPSGIVVASQHDRSQHKNRATAMNMLKARLYEAELARREAAAGSEYEAKTEIGWGHQIRSYVLQPYQMVKDLRTGVTSPTPDDVLDGELDEFVAAALAQRVTGEAVEVEDVE